MAKEKYENRGNGVLYDNENKSNPNAPIYTGPLTIREGEEPNVIEKKLRLSIFIPKEEGKPYRYSVAVQEVSEEQDAPF